MRRFNPEKELSKIRNGNKNKIIVGLCALLLIVVLGYSFALYQVRHTRELVFNTVDEFVKKDIVVSVLIDNESKPDFPLKEDGYVYSDYKCENDGVITFDSENWEFTLKNNKPDKCVIKFSSNPFKANACKDLPMSECLLLEEQHTNKELAYDDPDGNARYIGGNPSNYIRFNCDDYSNPSESTCERWRIVGSFKNIEKVNEDGVRTTEKQNLVKIVRDESIGEFSWDEADDANTLGSNAWATATLQEYLNKKYYNGETINNIKGVTESTKEIIEKVEWNLGGSSVFVTAKEFYEKERGKETYQSQQSIWQGHIGLMYPSDYGYATIGGKTKTRKDCLESTLYDWSLDEYRIECGTSDWLRPKEPWLWTITPLSTNPTTVFDVNAGGNANIGAAAGANAVRPTLYLTHDTKITGGDGTYENPYTIDTIK